MERKSREADQSLVTLATITENYAHLCAHIGSTGWRAALCGIAPNAGQPNPPHTAHRLLTRVIQAQQYPAEPAWAMRAGHVPPRNLPHRAA